MYKASLVDANTYQTTLLTVNNKANRDKLSYNLLVLEADIAKLRKDLDNLNSFNGTVTAKRRLLLTTLDNNYRILRDAVGVDKEQLQGKINEIQREINIARDTWKTSALNDPITNTVTGLLEI